MAKKNGRDDPPKPQVAENEQMSDIILILDKMELILQAVSQIDKDGRYKTVPADKEHTNSFLKIDRYASMFENFLKNFWSQLQDPTRFGILTIKEDTLDNPEVRQAVEDIAAGKQTKAVEEFLKKYEIVPRWKSHATLTLLATQDLPTFGYNMIDPLKSWCWGSILFYPFKISRFS